MRTFDNQIQKSKIQNLKSKIDMAYIGCERFDGFGAESLNPWEVATGVLIIEVASRRFLIRRLKIQHLITADLYKQLVDSRRNVAIAKLKLRISNYE